MAACEFSNETLNRYWRVVHLPILGFVRPFDGVLDPAGSSTNVTPHSRASPEQTSLFAVIGFRSQLALVVIAPVEKYLARLFVSTMAAEVQSMPDHPALVNPKTLPGYVQEKETTYDCTRSTHHRFKVLVADMTWK